MASRVPPFSSFVVDISSFCPPGIIGRALAKLWVIDGQELVRTPDVVECPITLAALKKPVLLCDGDVYEEVAIAQ